MQRNVTHLKAAGKLLLKFPSAEGRFDLRQRHVLAVQDVSVEVSRDQAHRYRSWWEERQVSDGTRLGVLECFVIDMLGHSDV